MLSITKINSASNQIASGSGQGKGYLHYLGAPSSNHGPAHDKAQTGAAIDPSLLDTLSETEAEQLPGLNKDKLKEYRDRKRIPDKAKPTGGKPPKT